MTVDAEHGSRHVGTIWMMNLDEPVPVVQPTVRAVFQPLLLEDLPVFQSKVASETYGEWIERFKMGRRCYAALVEDQIVCYGWVSLEQEDIGELNLQIKLLAGEVYIWDCVTNPAFRQKRLYSALLSYMIGELRREGFQRVWIGADLENLPSQQGMARAGFHHVADLVIERGQVRRQIWVDGRPGIPEQIVEEARRAFLNDRD